MINSVVLLDILKKNKFNKFFGVPDSCLNGLIQCVDEKDINIFPNEGNALCSAFAFKISTGENPIIFLQNSGLGNLLDPLQSLVSEKVYYCPMLYIIGYRGNDDKDAPQHSLCGKTTKELLLLHNIIPIEIEEFTNDTLNELILLVSNIINNNKKSVAILVKKGTLTINNENIKKQKEKITHKKATEIILKKFYDYNYFFVTSAGIISRQFYHQIRRKAQILPNVGALGHAASIGISLAKYSTGKRIVVIEGDGSFVMHLGGLCMLNTIGNKDYIHIVLNNESHASVGGAQSSIKGYDITKIARAVNFQHVYKADDIESLEKVLNLIKKLHGTIFLEISIDSTLVKPLPPPIEIDFVELMNDCNNFFQEKYEVNYE